MAEDNATVTIEEMDMPKRNNDVIGSLMFENAKKEYPYLADKDIAFDYAPGQGRGFLEFYSPEETGSPEYPRPQNIPLGRVGVQVFDPKTYVSHYGVENDPYLSERYQQFQQSFTPEQQQRLQEQYAYYQQHPEYKESRPYEEWLKASGMPGYFRGYTFNQWDDAKDMYTPEQLKTLDAVRSYLRIK
jgi:hypothetical protein